MTTEWQVIVTFAGLILFVQDKDSKLPTISHALLADGRAGHHHHGSTLPSDIDDCDHLVRADFDHRPLLWWETGEADSPVLGQDGIVLRRIGDEDLADRSEIFLRWCCNGKVCADEAVATCSLANTGSICGADEKPHKAGGATPQAPDARALGRLPKREQYESSPGERRSFFWVPKLQDLGMDNTVTESCLDGWKDAPSSLFTRVPLGEGIISSGDYGWVSDEGVPWVPRLRFLSDEDGGGRMKRAGAEVVHWEATAPEGATKLQIVRRSFSKPKCEAVIESFQQKESPIRITISNSPKRRCLGRSHPGRKADTATMHFEMLYDLLAPPVTGNPHDASLHISPAERLIPRAPKKIHAKWCPVHGRTVVPYRPWWPQGGGEESPRSAPRRAVRENLPFGDIADAVGTKERPICIPAYSDG